MPTLGIKLDVKIEHRRGKKLLSRQNVKNIAVNAGLNWARTHLGSSGTTRADYIGLSSNVSAPAAGDTDLGVTVLTDSGLARAQGTYAAGGTGVYTMAKTFTATATKTVASVGLYYSATTPDNLLAGVAVASVTLATNDTLTITWTVTVANV